MPVLKLLFAGVCRLLNQVFIWQHDCPIKLIWKTPVTSSNHHNTNHKFAECVKLAAQRNVDGWVPKAEANIATRIMSVTPLRTGKDSLTRLM